MSAEEQCAELDSDQCSQASDDSFHSARSFEDAEGGAALSPSSWNKDADESCDVGQLDAKEESEALAQLLQNVTVQMRPEGLTSIDARRGVTMFFRNEFQQSEDFLSLGKDSIPVFAVSHGVITMLKALMTFDDGVKMQALSLLLLLIEFVFVTRCRLWRG
jgi:hypothetical protein